jgi:cation diffusion facilitator CzcD-associated flavoprotein CzcO
VQIVPQIQPVVGHLSVFQRTPAWVMPRMDHRIPDRRRALFRRLPILQKANRALQYAAREALVIPFVKRPALSHRIERGAHDHLARQVRDPDLRERLTPSFTLGCKRILLSNDWYPTLTRPNVDLVTAPIDHVAPDGITTADGVHHRFDTIILATGFNATDHPMGHVIHGIGGQSLSDSWTDGMRAYLGMTAPGFPNFFTLMGPNTGLGHSSIVFMLESQVNYVVDAVRQMDERDLAVVDVRPATAAAFDEEMQRRLAGSVWNTGGCSSWYLDEQGRNPTMWPGFTFEYRRRTRHFDLAAYRARRRRPAAAPAHEAYPAPT